MYVSRKQVQALKVFGILMVCLVLMLILEAKKAEAASASTNGNSLVVVKSVSDSTGSTKVKEEVTSTQPNQSSAPEVLNSYADVVEDYWAFNSIQKVAELGLDPSEKFRPRDNITATGFVTWLTKAGIKPNVSKKFAPGQLLKKQDVIALLGTNHQGKSTWYGLDFPDDSMHENYLNGCFFAWEIIPTYEANGTVTRAEAAFILHLLILQSSVTEETTTKS